VFLGVYTSNSLGGAGHLNPAVTIALAVFGDFNTSEIATFIGAQFAGAFVGSIISWIAYKQHFDETPDQAAKLSVFSTGPAIRSYANNIFTEVIATFILVFGALNMSKSAASMGALDALPVALLILGIGLGLGGPTGFAINPARDLAPRIAHAILPMKGKGGSDWGYAWVPVVAPIIGALLAALIYKQLHNL
jgi:glycerol uptake facilitator protein